MSASQGQRYKVLGLELGVHWTGKCMGRTASSSRDTLGPWRTTSQHLRANATQGSVFGLRITARRCAICIQATERTWKLQRFISYMKWRDSRRHTVTKTWPRALTGLASDSLATGEGRARGTLVFMLCGC